MKEALQTLHIVFIFYRNTLHNKIFQTLIRFIGASKGTGKCLYGSPAMDVATEKRSCTQKNNENQGCIRCR